MGLLWSSVFLELYVGYLEKSNIDFTSKIEPVHITININKLITNGFKNALHNSTALAIESDNVYPIDEKEA